jgi:hypothetical protein
MPGDAVFEGSYPLSAALTPRPSGSFSFSTAQGPSAVTPAVFTSGVPSFPINNVFPIIYTPAVVTDAIKYRILVFDKSNKLATILTQVSQFDFIDAVNGGSAQGSFVIDKHFIDTNWFNYDYRVEFYFEDSFDPWYCGYISEFDPEQDDDDVEYITIYTAGYQTFLDRAVVSEILSPGVQPNGVDNGDYYADAYLVHLLTTYLDSAHFAAAFVGSIPIYLDALTFTGEGLGKCVDDVVKQVSSNTGQIYEWWVRGQWGGLPRLIIQVQSNPNNTAITDSFVLPSGKTPVQFITEIKDETMYGFKITNSAAAVYNLIALYGGNDPNTGEQVYNAYQDSTSIALYGARQQRVTNNVLLSQASLTNYATAYLLNNAYPQPQGQFNKWVPFDFARAGVFFQIIIKGLSSTGETFVQTDGSTMTNELPQINDQVRAIQIEVNMQGGTGDRIAMTVSTQAPRPFADNASYNAIVQSKNDQAALTSTNQRTNLKTYFVQDGFDWIS